MQRNPGAQSLLSVQGPVLLPLVTHKPPVQMFPQPSRQLLSQVVTTQGTEAPDETVVIPEPAVVLPVAALVIVPELPPAAPEPLPAAMPDPAVMPPPLAPALVPLSRPPQPTAIASVEMSRVERGTGTLTPTPVRLRR
jgi:hypothetical protein